MVTESVAAAWLASNGSVVPPTNSQRSSSSDMPATATVNAASWTGSTVAVTVAVAPSASSSGATDSVSAGPSTMVAVPVSPSDLSAIRASVVAGSDSVTVKSSRPSPSFVSSVVRTDTLPDQRPPRAVTSNASSATDPSNAV